MKGKCYYCGKENVELYHVSKVIGYCCAECAKNFIRELEWYKIDLKTLVLLKDKDLIEYIFEDSKDICYCNNCGYFDFLSSFPKNKCPECGSEDTRLYFIDYDYIKRFFQLSLINEELNFLNSIYYDYWQDLEKISKAIARATNFINVATYILDSFFAGNLGNAYNNNIKVHVIVGRIEKLKEIIRSSWSFKFFIRYYPEIHVKLIVIDGILAFKGSANLTFNGWKEDAIELREMVTIPEEVKELNNKFLTYYRFAKEIE